MDINVRKHFLLGVSFIAISFATQTPTLAQEQEETAKEQEANNTEGETDKAADGEFLGTIVLGESKRDVQTDTHVPLTTITQVEIDDRQANTIAELIDSVPGVTLVNGSTPNGSGINIRGFGSNNTFGSDQKIAIIVDGANTGAEEIYRIGTQLFTDPFLYKSVDVIRGTVGSFEYGSGIVGGVVKLETRDASDFTGGEPGFNAALTLGAQTNEDGYNGSATLAWQASEKFELLGNFSYREQGIQKDGDGVNIGNSAFDLPSFLIKTKYSFNNENTITASYTHSEASDRDVPYDTFLTSDNIFGNVDRDTKSQTLSVLYNYNPQENDLLDLALSFTYANQEIDQQYIEGSSAFAPPGGFAVVNADHQYETSQIRLKNKSFFDTGPFSHELRQGVEFTKRKRQPANSAPGGEDDRFAVFLVDTIEFADGWELIPSVRYETSSIDGVDENGENERSVTNDGFMGGVSLRYEFRNGLSFFGSYAHTENLPILDDLTTQRVIDVAEDPADLLTTSEIADTFELGFAYYTAFGDGNIFAVKANYYDTELDDVTTYSGVSEVDIQGVEIESNLAFQSGLYFDFNGNFTDGNELRTSGVVVDWRNAPQNSIRLTTGMRFIDQIDLSAEYIALLDTARSNLDRAGNLVETVTENFNIFNLRVTYTPQDNILEGLTFRLGLENAFGETYRPLLATRNAPGQNFKFTVSRIF